MGERFRLFVVEGIFHADHVPQQTNLSQSVLWSLNCRAGPEDAVPFGEYPYTIDDKGRVVIPPAFREFVEDGLILTRGMEGCLYVFPLTSWKRVEEQLEGLPLTDAESRAFVRFFYSGASKSRLDNQSRVSIPQSLRTFADLQAEVIVAGAPGRLEFWSPGRWDAVINAVQTNPPKPELLANFVA